MARKDTPRVIPARPSAVIGHFVLAAASIGLAILGPGGCRGSHRTASAERTDKGVASATPDLDGLQVEFRSSQFPAHMAPGSQGEVRFEAKNVGTKPWPAAGAYPFRFGYHWEAPSAEGNWAVVVWDDSNRAGLQADVQPGDVVSVTLPVRALPNVCPNCRLVVAPLLEMRVWSENAKSIAPVNVS